MTKAQVFSKKNQLFKGGGWRLTELEATFRSLKSDLGLRPGWHQLSKRNKGHLFIAVLALYGVNVIRTRLAAQATHYRRATLRNKLGRWRRASKALTTTGGSRIELRCDIRPDPDVAATAKAAGTSYAPETRIRRLANHNGTVAPGHPSHTKM